MAMTDKLVGAARDLKDIVRNFGAMFIMLIVFALVIGVISQNVYDGSINTSSAGNTSVQSLEGSYDTQVTDNATSASGTTTSLIVLAIILALFAGFLASKRSKGDMGGLS